MGDVWGAYSKERYVEKSHFQHVLDEIVNNQIYCRKKYFENLMVNPGFLSTFDEFDVEFGEMEVLNDVDHNPIDEIRVRFVQEVRFRRRPE